MAGQPIVIVGAGGFGREVAALIMDIEANSPGTWDLRGFIADDSPTDHRIVRLGLQFLGTIREFSQTLSRDTRFVVAIGDGKVREQIDERLGSQGLQPASLVHPTAIIGPDTDLGPGSVVCAYSVLTTNVRIGRSAQINIGCVLGHDVVLEDYVTLSPSVNLSGHAFLGTQSSAFTKAVVLPGVRVEHGATIGAGAVVNKDVASGTTVVGIPARPIARD